jgi:hypothetical protein
VSDTPALDYCLRETDDYIHYGPGGGSCVGWDVCPFAVTPSYEERAGGDVSNDRAEAHYDCRLLGRKVWGEDPPCTEVQWRARAREELAAGVTGAHFRKGIPT